VEAFASLDGKTDSRRFFFLLQLQSFFVFGFLFLFFHSFSDFSFEFSLFPLYGIGTDLK